MHSDIQNKSEGNLNLQFDSLAQSDFVRNMIMGQINKDQALSKYLQVNEGGSSGVSSK